MELHARGWAKLGVEAAAGARGSLLSRMQSEMVARQLEAAVAGLRVEMVIVATLGDRIADRPLHEFGGKGLFTKELEQALLRGEVDFAVHSFKDVPVTMPLVDVGAGDGGGACAGGCAGRAGVAEGAEFGGVAGGGAGGDGSLRRRARCWRCGRMWRWCRYGGTWTRGLGS